MFSAVTYTDLCILCISSTEKNEGFSNVSEKLMLEDMEINGKETVMSNEQINACDNSRCGRKAIITLSTHLRIRSFAYQTVDESQ